MSKNIIGAVDARETWKSVDVYVHWSQCVVADVNSMCDYGERFDDTHCAELLDKDCRSEDYAGNLGRLISDIQAAINVFGDYPLTTADIQAITDAVHSWINSHSSTRADGTPNAPRISEMEQGQLRAFLDAYDEDTRRDLINRLAGAGFDGTDDPDICRIYAAITDDADRQRLSEELVDLSTYTEVLDTVDYEWPDDAMPDWQLCDWQLRVCQREFELNLAGRWLDACEIEALKEENR